MEKSKVEAASIIDEPPSLVLHHSLDEFTAQQWDRLAHAHPFMRHAFLRALHNSGCANNETGWTPLCLALRRGTTLTGAMLLYLKRHSRGEYVFDHAWADAYRRQGLVYYPKLLAAVPFTPVTGPRLLADNPADKLALARGALALAEQNELSSLHVLFAGEADIAIFKQAGYLVRQGVQFHWHNKAYADFSAFLASMSKDKRKKILQDRKRVAAEGITFRWLRGQDIQTEDLDFFYACYVTTYHEHGNAPYLSREAFASIQTALPDDLLLIVAHQGDTPIACALDVVHGQTLYGRYWGARAFVSGLHFETCYMQSIAYCIAHGLTVFEGGAQGEHKIARGLLPVPTYSAHWITHPGFARAIAAFLDEEAEAINGYRGQLDEHNPFK